MDRAARDGLGWEERRLFATPKWTREPDLEAVTKVCRNNLPEKEAKTCEVSFHTEGMFNKLYLVQTSERKLIMRITLPLCPRSKTRGEVTTLRFLRRETKVPVPEVIAFNDSAENEIGFEWILMEFMPGAPLGKKWRTLTMSQKVAITKRLAEFQAELFQHPFSGIGTLTDEPVEGKKEQKEQPGEMVFFPFFMREHYNWDVPRGPFRSSHDWLFSHLQIAIKKYQTELEKAEDEEDREWATSSLKDAQRLIELLPKIFPSIQDRPERSVIVHEYLSLYDVFIDGQGTITAIVDWEHVSTMPLWRATDVPSFLEGPDREEEPNRDGYGDARVAGFDPELDDDPDLDNEGKNIMYWEHLLEYDATQLRKVYHETMCQLRPDWNAELEESVLKGDFTGALACCEEGVFRNVAGKWVDAIEKGEFPSLDEF